MNIDGFEIERKYLIAMPDMNRLVVNYGAVPFEMMQNYLVETNPSIERRIRRQKNGPDYLYFYTEKHKMPDETYWDTERPISRKEYERYLLEAEPALREVHKVKYRFNHGRSHFEIDVYPFSKDKAVMFFYSDSDEVNIPPEIQILQEVTGNLNYKNKTLAATQSL